MLTVTVGYFEIACDQSADDIQAAVRKYGTSPPAKPDEVTILQKTYRLTNPKWERKNELFSGTMWRVRRKNLPSAWKNGQARRVGNELCEGASFAFNPSKCEVVIQQNGNGPRHRVFANFLEKIGVPGPIEINPKLRTDALARLNRASIVRKIEYSLGDMPSPELIRNAGVGNALDSMEDVGGAVVHVTISLGKKGKKNGSLSSAAKSIMARLANLNGVQTLKASVKETEDQPSEMLDLLECRRTKECSVDEIGMQLDHSNCRKKLRFLLRKPQK